MTWPSSADEHSAPSPTPPAAWERAGVRAVRWVVVVSLLSVSCVPGPPPQPPKLEFVALRHTAGHVNAGETVTHTFEFRNAGGLDLSIDNVRAACGCTAATP